MDSMTSPFALARPRVSLPKQKKRPSFLDLPGEIRNRVYQYYIEEFYRCELVSAGSDFSTATPKINKLVPNIGTAERYSEDGQKTPKHEKPVVFRFQKFHVLKSATCNPPPQRWLNPHGALILVCKQTYAETLPMLYRRTALVFEAPRRILGFLRKVPRSSCSYVTKLHLYYTTYGNPEAACDVIWQEKHVESWTRACKTVAKSLNCLRELEIDVWINADAPKFNLRQKWLQPLWQFRGLACSDLHKASMGNKLVGHRHSLTTVYVRVKSRLFSHHFDMNMRLANACKHLHRLYGHGISNAILGAKEKDAMSAFDKAWHGKYHVWQHHLGFAKSGW